MIESNIHVKLDKFDGPLGLVLHLIQREEMSIRDLNIKEVTDQYLDYLKKMKDLNFDIAGEYLYMAATLLYIKSKEAVTEEENQRIKNNQDDITITTKTQLIEKLEELERFQRLGEKMMALPKLNEDVFIKPKVNRKAIANSILTPMDLQELTNTMIDLIRREKRKYTVVKRDRLSIKEKLIELKNNLKEGSQTTLTKLINLEKGDGDIVITFISLLELARLKKLEIFQNEDRGEVYVDVKESLASFDVETADGFEPEKEDNEVSTEDLAQAAKVANTTQEAPTETLQ
jgi:segregation and condensation protein A